MTNAGRIRCGIGGWTFEPWRGVFYPEKLSQKRELEYASRHLTAIEINGTYYSSFKPDSWAKWRESTPSGFKFAVKASRFCVNRKKLTDGAQSIGFFMNQGLEELQDRQGAVGGRQYLGESRAHPDLERRPVQALTGADRRNLGRRVSRVRRAAQGTPPSIARTDPVVKVDALEAK